MVKIDGVFPKGIFDILNTVCSEDIEGIASEPCEDAGIGSDSALIFDEGGVSDIVILVLDTPMASDGGRCLFCRELGRADMQRGFVPALPQTSFGILDEGVAADPDHALQVGRPLGSGGGVADIEDLGLPVFAAVTGEILGQGLVNRPLGFRHREDAFKQLGLVLLQLDQKMTACLARRLEGFFDNA